MKPPQLMRSSIHNMAKPSTSKRMMMPMGKLKIKGRPRKVVDKRKVAFF